MLMLILLAALSGQAAQDAPTEVEALTVEGARKGAKSTLPDGEIIQQLNALRRAEPDRVGCVKKVALGSVIARPACASLREWYDIEVARDTRYAISSIKPEGRSMPGPPPPFAPPDELVELIKQRLKDPDARAQAAQRAQRRSQTGAASGPG